MLDRRTVPALYQRTAIAEEVLSRTVVRTMDLRSVAQLISRRIKLFAAVALVIFAASVGGIFLLTPIYASSASILFDEQQPPGGDLWKQAGENVPNAYTAEAATASVGNIAEVIKSRSTAHAVVERLHLADQREFTPRQDDWLSYFDPEPNNLKGQARLEAVVDRVLRNLTVERVASTKVLTISFRSKVPETASAVANAFADEFLNASRRINVATLDARSKWLDSRMAELNVDVQQADAAVAAFKAKNGFAGLGSTGGTLTERQLTDITARLEAAEDQRVTAEADARAAHEQVQAGNIDAIPGVVSSPVIADLRRQKVETLRREAATLTQYDSKYPLVRDAEQLMKRIDRSILEEAQRIVAGLDATAGKARARVEVLRARQAEAKARLGDTTDSSVTLAGLTMVADAKRLTYNKVAGVAQLLRQENGFAEPPGRLISQAPIPFKPAFPNKILFGGLGFLLSLLGGATAVFLVSTMETTFRSADDIERETGQSCLASVPLLSRQMLREAGQGARPQNYAAERPLSAFAEAFRNVRNAIYTSPSGMPAKLITVASALSNEGKTVTAISLAYALAGTGRKVVLLDCDFRRRSLSRYLKAEGAGMKEILEGSVSLRDAIANSQRSGPDIVPAGASAGVSPSLLLGDAMMTLLNELSATYDHVVLDVPPILAVSEASALAVRSDAVVFVVRWASTRYPPVRIALERLRRSGAPVAGIVLSMVNMKKQRTIGDGDVLFYHGSLRQYYEG